MKNTTMKKFRIADIALIAANIIPVLGVWFWGWNPTEAFIVYALETLIIGILTICKLLAATLARGYDEWPANGSVTKQSGLFFILFFIAHFGLFALIQTTMFSQSAGITPPGSGLFHFFFKWYTYLNKDILYMLIAFALSYVIRSFIPFIVNNEYKTTPFMLIMFQPYGRIIIQQFTVILGSMFLTLGAEKIFILVFAAVKIYFELFINFESILNKITDKLKEQSTKK